MPAGSSSYGSHAAGVSAGKRAVSALRKPFGARPSENARSEPSPCGQRVWPSSSAGLCGPRRCPLHDLGCRKRWLRPNHQPRSRRTVGPSQPGATGRLAQVFGLTAGELKRHAPLALPTAHPLL